MTNPYIDQTIEKAKTTYKSMSTNFHEGDSNKLLRADLHAYSLSESKWDFKVYDSQQGKHIWEGSLSKVIEALTSHDELVDAVKACVLSLSELIVGIATGEDTEAEAAYQKGLTILAKLEGEDV